MIKYWFYKFIITWILISGNTYDPSDDFLKEENFQKALFDCAKSYKLGVNYYHSPEYTEITTLRNYYNQIISRFKESKTLPPITDYYLFPTKESVQDVMSFQGGLINFYKNRAAIEPHLDYTPLIDDLSSRQDFYWNLYNGIVEKSYGDNWEFEARRRLLKLQNMLGYDNYYKGIIPTPVNLSALKVLD